MVTSLKGINKDRKEIKQTAENYPETSFYKTEDIITQLGIGEALVTLLLQKALCVLLVIQLYALLGSLGVGGRTTRKKFKKTFKFSCLRAFSHYLCLGFS